VKTIEELERENHRLLFHLGQMTTVLERHGRQGTLLPVTAGCYAKTLTREFGPFPESPEPRRARDPDPDKEEQAPACQHLKKVFSGRAKPAGDAPQGRACHWQWFCPGCRTLGSQQGYFGSPPPSDWQSFVMKLDAASLAPEPLNYEDDYPFSTAHDPRGGL